MNRFLSVTWFSGLARFGALGIFYSSLYQLFYKLLIIWVFYSFLLPVFGLSNCIFGILYTMFTLVLLRHLKGVFYNCSFSILYLPFVLLRQKWGVFFVLDRECIFKPIKWFLSQNGQRGSLLIYDWLHSIDKITTKYCSSASVWTPVKVWGELGFPLQTQIWEDSCNRPDAILDKARRGEELQQFGRQSNIVRTPVLIMKIACSWSATI